MAIKRTTAFVASDGSVCGTLEEAQRHELALVWMASAKLPEEATETAKDNERKLAVEFAHLVQDEATTILDILTTGPRSRPAARKVKGTTAPRRATKAAMPASTEAKVERLREETFKAGVAAIRAAVDEGVPT